MLSFAALMRFALSHSPFREQREILFAEPKKKRERLGGTEQPEASDESLSTRPEAVHVQTSATHREVTGVLSTIDFQEAFSALKTHLGENEVFEQMLESEETLESIDIADAARHARIPLPEARTTTTPEARRALLRAIDEQEKTLSPQDRQHLLERLIQKSPQVTLALVRASLHRLSVYEEQQRLMENCRSQLPPEPGRSAEIMAEVTKIAQGEISLKKAMENLTVGEEQPAMNVEEVSKLRTLLKQAAKAQKIIVDFGARFWGSTEPTTPTQDDLRKKEYLEHLRTQALKFTELLALQLELDARGAQNRFHGAARDIAQRNPETEKNDYVIDRFGKLDGRCNKAIAATGQLRQIADRISPQDPSLLEKLEDILREAEKVTGLVANVQRDTIDTVREESEHPLQNERQEQRAREQWAERCGRMIGLLQSDPSLSTEMRARISDLQKIIRDPEMLAAIEDKEMGKEEYVLLQLTELGEGRAQELEETGERWKKDSERELGVASIEEWTEGKRTTISTLEGDLKNLLTHPICARFGIQARVGEYAEYLRSKIAFFAKARKENIPEEKRREELTRLGVMVTQMQTARNMLAELEEATSGDIPETGNNLVIVLSREELVEKFGVRTSRGCYANGRIYIRADVTGEARRQLIHHEKAHFILSILTEQSFLFPELLEARIATLDTETIKLLETQGERWGISWEEIRSQYEALNRTHIHQLSPSLLGYRVRAKYHRALFEEAMVRQALASESGAPPSAQDAEVFAALAPREKIPENVTIALHQTGDEASAVDEETMASAEADGGSYDAMEDLESIERMITSIHTFGVAYPAFQGQVQDILGTGQGDNKYRDILAEFRHIHENGETRNHRKVDPLHNPKYRETVKDFLENHVQETYKRVQELDSELSNPEKAATAAPMSLSQKLGIQWLCILDVIRIYKEFKEDIVGMWKTDQDRKTAEAEAAIAQNLPVRILGYKIPIAGKYTERMSHYAERRRNQLELDRVKKWEDAFKNLDAEDLLDLIGKDPTKDQLRASIELLVGKGRMNWGDTRVWNALNKFSKYHMPIGPCKRSEILRDKWLQKLISDIWKDRDMFDGWMTTNDGNYDKQKKAYTHAADNYSNIAGGMARELRSILSTFVECKSHVPPLLLPEEVNPHHYEEILHYAMRNGKMSMEQKFYYLVQGVAVGLLPISRLRVLSGERGELLMKFPFLDYFYQRHNTMPEIRHIASQIGETVAGKSTFAPGSKTTMFIRLILLRDKKARERMSKAIDRVAENLDHEDVPYLGTDINWVTMQNMLDVISGSRTKVTKEGCKNLYIGFNEKFKTYAYLAQLSEETGKPVFRDSDVRDLAQSLAAYVVFDNQMMRATTVGLKVNLGREQLEEGPVSNPALHTSAFRDRTRDFVLGLAQAIGMTDADLETPGLTIRDFLASAERDQRETQEPIQKNNLNATKFFAQAFARKIMANPDALKRLLMSFAAGSYHEGKSFLDMGTRETGDSKYTYDAFKERYAEVSALAT